VANVSCIHAKKDPRIGICQMLVIACYVTFIVYITDPGTEDDILLNA